MMIPARQIILLLVTILSVGCARKNFYAATPVADPVVYQQLLTAPATVDSVTIQAGKHYKRSWLHELFWGEHYRPLWTAPVTVPVLDMDTVKGGLEIEKLGGGQQTTSLSLAGKDGFTYALRSVNKDPAVILSGIWRKSFAANIVRDQMSALNPYGALMVPPLAEAAGVPHANPKVVYVQPNYKPLGKYEDLISDNVYMLEEKFNDERALTPMLGDAEDIAGSKKVFRDRFGKDDHFIDQLAFARARILDILIHDWDRHEGQWEWSEHKKDGETIYRPIPKDRDNAFFRFQDGIIPWIFSRNWAIRKFESFDADINDVYALIINSEFIDQRALSQVTEQQFDSLARTLQAAFTDEVITEAVRRLPKPVYKLEGERTTRKLLSRRDQLDEAAREFYKLLAREALVVGTDDEERFEVKRLNNDETSVVVYRKSDDKPVYRRVFYRSETELIQLYGLAEDDEFEISGEVDEGIKIEIYGGRGEDEIKDTSNVRRGGKKTWVYDTINGTNLEAGPETKDKRTHDIRVHAFDREGY